MQSHNGGYTDNIMNANPAMVCEIRYYFDMHFDMITVS